MARISKAPEARKKELLETAGRLFRDEGYDRTSVGDVVGAVGISQGAFYYHFKSKEELLAEVVELEAERIWKLVEEADRREPADPVERINRIIGAMAHARRREAKLTDLLHEERNFLLHEKIARRFISRLVPLLSEIIETGKARGLFEVANCYETAELVLGAISALGHSFVHDPSPGRLARIEASYAEFMDRALRAKPGSFHLTV